MPRQPAQQKRCGAPSISQCQREPRGWDCRSGSSGWRPLPRRSSSHRRPKRGRAQRNPQGRAGPASARIYGAPTGRVNPSVARRRAPARPLTSINAGAMIRADNGDIPPIRGAGMYKNLLVATDGSRALREGGGACGIGLAQARRRDIDRILRSPPTIRCRRMPMASSTKPVSRQRNTAKPRGRGRAERSSTRLPRRPPRRASIAKTALTRSPLPPGRRSSRPRRSTSAMRS